VRQGAPGLSRPAIALPTTGQPNPKVDTPAPNTTESVNDLRLQIRELTNANLELREQLK